MNEVSKTISDDEYSEIKFSKIAALCHDRGEINTMLHSKMDRLARENDRLREVVTEVKYKSEHREADIAEALAAISDDSISKNAEIISQNLSLKQTSRNQQNEINEMLKALQGQCRYCRNHAGCAYSYKEEDITTIDGYIRKVENCDLWEWRGARYRLQEEG